VSDELARLRERLAARVISAHKIRSDLVAAALRAVPRHLFLPDLPPEQAYRDDAIVIKRDAEGLALSSSSQPAIMAIMLDQLDLAPGQRVLEIGAGTGYNAALMRHIVGPSGQVVSVDIDSDLTDTARAHLASAGYPDVIVVCADGAEGCAAHAPYDRVIATVGVSDLAQAWLDQVTPGARIVVPLNVRGTQLSVAFERSDGHWASQSLAPCGFIRMRGALAGPERAVVIQPGLVVTVPDGRDIDPEALAAALAGPGSEQATGVRTGPMQVFSGLSLWLAVHEPRLCTLDERWPNGRRHAGAQAAPRAALKLDRAPLRDRRRRVTIGILDPGGIAVLTTASPTGEGTRGRSFGLTATGYGPGAPELAAELAARVAAWNEAGQPATDGLHVPAYPRWSGNSVIPAPAGGVVIERPGTRFVLYHDSGSVRNLGT
jgi:protein-L-isoaspartate(D-aspartate) O-methyltransferase